MKKNKILLLIIKEKKFFTASLIAGLLLFIAYLVFLYTPLYSSQMKIFVRNIKKPNIITDYSEGSTVYSETGFSNPLFNLIQILESDVVAEHVYDVISEKYNNDLLKMGIKSKEGWVTKYKSLIGTQIEPSTDVIKISFKWPSPSSSNSVLLIILEQFKNVSLDIRKSVEKKQSKYLSEQLLNISDQLDHIRNEIKNYKVENEAVDIENKSLELTKAIVDLEKESKFLNGKIKYYREKYENLKSQLNVPNIEEALKAVSIGDDPYIIEQNEQLAKVKQKYGMLKSKFTDNYPDVIAVKNEFKVLEDNIENRKKEILGNIKIKKGLYDRTSQEIVAEISKCISEEASLKSQLNNLENSISQLTKQESYYPGKISGLEDLKKEESALALAYQRIKGKQLEAVIIETEIVDNLVILNEPSKPKYNIKSLLIKFIGFLGIAFLLALAISLIKEDIQNKWINSDEIEEVTGQKILGIIPWVKNPEIIKNDFELVIQKSDSLLGISYSEIVNNIVRQSYLHDIQAISFYSTLTSRGKPSIIPNITASLTRLNKSVILIVTDQVESQKILDMFGIKVNPKKKDLIDIIERINIHMRISKSVEDKMLIGLLEEAFQPIVIEGTTTFQMLYVGKNVNVHDYVATKGFITVIDFLKNYYEFVLVDTPIKPLIFPDFNAISNVSDGIIIISAMETNRDDLIKVIDKFEKQETKILGIIAREEKEELERFFASKLNDKLS